MIKLTDNQIAILGKPNFSCAQPAKLLIAADVYEAKTSRLAEYEQAVFIHWAQGLLAEHGDNWAEAGKAILIECVENLPTGE